MFVFVVCRFTPAESDVYKFQLGGRIRGQPYKSGQLWVQLVLLTAVLAGTVAWWLVSRGRTKGKFLSQAQITATRMEAGLRGYGRPG